MSVQRAIRIHLPNRPGELVRLSKQLAAAGVNIEAGAGVAGTGGEDGILEFMVSDIPAAVQALRQQGISFQETQVALAWLANKPGTLAQALAPLADAGINVESFYLVRTEGDRYLGAIGCSDAEKADRILSALSNK